MAVPVVRALSARLLHFSIPPTSESMPRLLQKCVGHAYHENHDYHDETLTKILRLPALPSLDLGEALPTYNDCVNDCPPDYTNSDALATLNLDPPAYAPSYSTSKCPSRGRKEESPCPTDPKVDFGYRDNLREHKKKKKSAAAKNKWDSDNEEEKKPDGDNNGDQPNDAGGSGGADGASGEGGEGNDDDDWDDGKKKGKKDKKKSAFSWDALDDEDNKDEEEKTDNPPPVEEAPVEEDDWGFTTASSKKKKKKAKNADPEPPPDVPKPDDEPPKVDVDFGNSNSFSFGSNGAWGTNPAENDGWATFGGSKKDKKKKANAFNFGFGDADDGAMPGESAVQPAEEEAKADDNPWAAFGSGKKKNKGGAVEESPLASPEPEPEPVAVQSPDDPADDFSWGMSAKDKKKAKKAAKAAAQAAVLAEPESEPIVVVEESPPEPEAPPAEPEPAPVDDFSWGMSAKDKKKAKKAAKKAGNAFEFVAEPEPPIPAAGPETEPPLVGVVEPGPPVVVVVEEPAPPAAGPDPLDDFSWGMSAKDKKKAKKAAKKSAFDWSEPDPPAAPEPPPVEEAQAAPDESTALVIPEPPQDDWFGWGTAGKKKGKKDAEEVPPEVPPPPPAALKPAVEESSSSWSFGWGSSSKKDKKKSKSPEPEPVPVPEPVLEDSVVMIPEAIDEPKAEEDDWAGWATGKKSKKKGSKNMPVEIVEPVYGVPVQQPDPAPAEEDVWAGWSVGKKEKKKGKKIDDIPPPPLPAIEPPPIEVIEPVVEVSAPPPEVQASVESPADDPWASFSTKKSKKDKKKKGSSIEEPQPVVEVPPRPPEPEHLVDLQEPEIESEPIVVLESPPVEEPVKEAKKKELKTSSGWGSSLWGSSSKSKSSSKDKEKGKEKKEKEEKERQEREAEEQRKADEEAAFAAALASEPVDLLPEPGPVVQEPISTGYWGTFLKPTAVSKTVEEPIVPKGKVDTGAKESVKDRIKRLQGENTKDQVVVVPPPAPAPEPLPEPEVVTVPEPEVIVVPEPSVVEEAPAKKSSKDKKKKKGKEKDSSPPPPPPPPPPPAAIEIPPPVVEVPPSLSPIPGGFPEDDVEVDVLADVPVVPPTIVADTSADAPVEPPPIIDAVKPYEETIPKPSSDKKPVKDKGASARKEVKKSTKSSRPAVVDLSAPSTPAAESKSVKKERPKVVRDPTGSSHWGLWGTTPKAEAKKERRPSKDTTTPTAKRLAAPGLTRSKSARKPNERDFLEKVDKTSSDDKQAKKNIKDPATPAKGMGFGLFGPTPTRSRSMRQSSSAQRPAQVRESRRSFDVSSPPGDIASKAAKLMGLGPRPSLSRSQSTREKRNSRTVPDPYAIDTDNTPDDATHSASVDRSSSHRTKRSSRSDHKHDKRDSAMMSGGLGPTVGDEADPITAPEYTPFVTPSRPMLKRSATTSARKPAGGLFSNIIDSLKSKPAEDFSRRYRSSQAYDSEDGSARHRRHRTPHSSHRDEDDDSKRHLRREHRRVRRPEDVPSTPLDGHAPMPPADNTESEERERRRAERRAKRAALEAAEEDLRAREKASRYREREEAERDREDLEDQHRRQRRAERHASRRSSAIDADRKPRLHRSSTAPVQSYFDARAPGRDANGRDPRSPPKDKTSSWVHSVTSSPPLPPPLQPTILDVPPTDPAVDDAGMHDDESTARELRRRHRRDRESRGVETEEDRKRRKRKELRRREEELAFRDRDGEIRRDRGSNKAYNSLGYDDFETQRTWDGRVIGVETRGGVKEEIARRTQGWLKKVAGL